MALLFPALVALWVAGGVLGVQVTVPQAEEECFFTQAVRGDQLSGSFEVLRGGMRDIDCSVTNPEGGVLWGRQRQRTGSFKLTAPSNGEYRLCFSNGGSSRAEKAVAFSLHVGDEVVRDIALTEHVVPLEAGVAQLAEGMQAIQDEQRYFWARERQARDTNEATNARILWFSLAEMALLLGVAGLQAWALVSHFGSAAVLGFLRDATSGK